ncbi:Bug family tripartite tricarboxylate transporter substrate binding protein [Thorsellia kenyensis]|uniref:Bug family tripartite tricarboxylate transporter substrate binding protein n=1 Tax=Thorsellia kenyensis TaxID=1549888 RepID=A0ABV6C952_9GAMM
MLSKINPRLYVVGLGIILPIILIMLGKTEGDGPPKPECVAPASPGGGFDLTCKLALEGFDELSLSEKSLRVTYKPGGVGAVAYNAIVSNYPRDPNLIVAFSSGSLLNIAQKKFGKFNENDVRWLAGIGVDYGMVAVKADSDLKTLEDLAIALKKDPKSISFGAGGSVGGQDWMQVALMTKSIGINPKDMKYVAMEGGGETMTNLLGGHIDVMSAGIAEVLPYLKDKKVRVLAVFAEERLKGSFKDVPTAIEQGYDVRWPVMRGFYTPKDISDKEFEWWKNNFDKLLASPEFAELRESRDLLEFNKTGEDLDKFVKNQVNEMRQLSIDFELIK